MDTVMKQLDFDTGTYFYRDAQNGQTFWDKPIKSKIVPVPASLPENPEDNRKHARRARERNARLRAIALKRQIWDQQKKKEVEVSTSTATATVEGLWKEAERLAVLNGGEFNMSWQELGSIHLCLFDFEKRLGTKLVSLRLVGHSLTELPSAVGERCRSLTSLSLCANRLTVLPDSLCDLAALTELNLLKNRLVTLPTRIGNLMVLKRLHLSSNALTALPPSFGNLTELSHVILDCNRLRQLPETLGLMQCKVLNVSANRLVALPHCIKAMRRLRRLLADDNGLQHLPSDIGESPSLTALHLRRNRISELPGSICQLRTLRVLLLDHNHMTGLPMEFHRLTALTRLMLEGNRHMVYPTAEVLAGGAEKVRQWCECRQRERARARRHTVVIAFQDILSQVASLELGPPQFFEADVAADIDHAANLYYAVVWEKFWEVILPRLELAWQAGAATPEAAAAAVAGLAPAAGFGGAAAGARRDCGLPYTREEVEAVLSTYSDPTGKVMREESAVLFRRCGCIDAATGRRRVCVPPKVGWMCERGATLVRSAIVLEREALERERQRNEQNDIAFRMDLARKNVREFAASEEGKLRYRATALEQADKIMQAKSTGHFKDEAGALLAHKQNRIREKTDKKRKELTAARDKRVKDMNERIRLADEEGATLRGWAKQQHDARVDRMVVALRELPEDAQIAALDAEEEKDLVAVGEEVSNAFKKNARRANATKANQESKVFKELVAQLVVDMVNTDAEHDAEKARVRAVREHKTLRTIMAMWVGQGLREVFGDWRQWARRRASQRRRDVRAAVRQAWHDFDAANVAVQLAEWKRGKWGERKWDEYQDAWFWVHADTQEARYEPEPTAEEFLPPGFVPPTRPTRALSDVSSDTESEGGGADGSSIFGGSSVDRSVDLTVSGDDLSLQDGLGPHDEGGGGGSEDADGGRDDLGGCGGSGSPLNAGSALMYPGEGILPQKQECQLVAAGGGAIVLRNTGIGVPKKQREINDALERARAKRAVYLAKLRQEMEAQHDSGSSTSGANRPPPVHSITGVMGVVGFDASREYTPAELTAMAQEAVELGRSQNVEMGTALSRFGARA